jgi:hypothetical protein
VRPVASDDAAYFVVDGTDDLEALLDLPADQFKFFRTEGTAVQEFHWHESPTRKLGHPFRNPNERVNVQFSLSNASRSRLTTDPHDRFVSPGG